MGTISEWLPEHTGTRQVVCYLRVSFAFNESVSSKTILSELDSPRQQYLVDGIYFFEALSTGYTSVFGANGHCITVLLCIWHSAYCSLTLELWKVQNFTANQKQSSMRSFPTGPAQASLYLKRPLLPTVGASRITNTSVGVPY